MNRLTALTGAILAGVCVSAGTHAAIPAEATADSAAVAPSQSDPVFREPYIDVDEWRDSPVRHRYVHGGFKGTNTRFSYYFPPKDKYQGRFFQYVTPVPDNENLSQGQTAAEDKIGFSATHGSYFVETNGGGAGAAGGPGMSGDATIGAYRAKAASAQYSRVVAMQMYGGKRPYGYLFGGSGGGYRPLGGMENTEGVWDGAVPYVICSPMAIPNMFTVRMYAQRVLKDKLAGVADAADAGGSGDIDAMPWQGDWYRHKAKENLGAHLDESFRLWYTDRANHGDLSRQIDATQTVSYLGVLQQALLDVSMWVEKGIPPAASTSYKVVDGQVVVPATAAQRKGIQPVVVLEANGGKRAEVSIGKPVTFIAQVEVPPGAGKIVTAEWDFEGAGKFADPAQLPTVPRDHATLKVTHSFSKPGTYFTVLRVASQRQGDAHTPFTQIQNLDRVRVVVR